MVNTVSFYSQIGKVLTREDWPGLTKQSIKLFMKTYDEAFKRGVISEAGGASVAVEESRSEIAYLEDREKLAYLVLLVS